MENHKKINQHYLFIAVYTATNCNLRESMDWIIDKDHEGEEESQNGYPEGSQGSQGSTAKTTKYAELEATFEKIRNPLDLTMRVP
jgi:hypothetical protein